MPSAWKGVRSTRGKAAAEKRRTTAGQRRVKVMELPKLKPGPGRRGATMVSVTSPVVHRPIGRGQRSGPMYGPTYDMTVHTQGKRPIVKRYK